MKKLFFMTLSLGLAVSVASCGKSSRGKMANDWKIASYERSDATLQNGNTTSSGLVTADETTIKSISAAGTVIAVLNRHEMKIKKDGTWEMIRDYTDNTLNYKIESSGTWGFVEKNKTEDFKKNERVIFHTLRNLKTNTLNGTVSTQLETYTNGENVSVYTITGSKGKELTMEYERQFSDAEQQPQIIKSAVKMTLKQK